MKKSRLFPLLAIVFLPSFLHSQQIIKGGYQLKFTEKVDNGPVEDQGSTGTCWSFSTSSFLEVEAIRSGKAPVDLSEIFFVRHNYIEKAIQYVRYHGTTNFGEGSLGHDVIRIYEKYGAMPEASYTGLVGGSTRHNHGALEKALKSFLDGVIKSDQITVDWLAGYNEILDKYLGELPSNFPYQGKTYDPHSFAKEFIGIVPEDYVSVTSFSHHPLYCQFVLEIPDNYARGNYVNVQLDDLSTIVNHGLSLGQSVVWDCDVSETGFSARQGFALVPEPTLQGSRQAPFDKPSAEQEITPEIRQQEFDNYGLTDDHLMQIVGSANDQRGVTYYYVKNSWGNKVGFDGYLFASLAYFRANTISILVHKEAIPQSVRSKFSGEHDLF